MKRITAIVLLMIVMYTLLILGSRAYGEAHPEPDELKALGFDTAFSLYYEKTTIETKFSSSNFVSPTLKVDRIDIIDPDFVSTFTDVSVQENPCHITQGDEISGEDSIWLGFASLQHYHDYA